MTRRLVRNAVVLVALAEGLLAIFDATDHRLPVMPADASPRGVLPAAFLLAVGVTLLEAKLIRRDREL